MGNRSEYRNILVAVSGLNPQIITETLYGLMVTKNIPIREIYIITTRTGEEKLNNSLLNASGPFYQFCAEYKILPHEIRIKPILIKSEQGEVLDDIRTREDNEAMAETIMETMFKLTREDQTRVFASIAGGRKTMSAYMALAMQLFGRKQDRLTHVLIWPPELESDKNFYFPPGEPRDIHTSAGKIIDWNEVRVDFAEIPFIRLRPMIQNWLGSELENYLELIKYSQFAIDELKGITHATWIPEKRQLFIEFGDRQFEVGTFPPKLAAVYHVLFSCDQPLQIHIQTTELEKVYEDLFANKVYDDKSAEPKWSPDTIQKDISSVNQDVLKKKLPEPIFNLLKISTTKAPDGRNAYYIKLPNENRVIR